MLHGVEDPRAVPWDSGFLVTVHQYPGSRHLGAFIHNSRDCVVNEQEQMIEFQIDGKNQTQTEKNWMPFLSHSTKDLKMIYSIEPLIILQCDHRDIRSCSSITEQKAPIRTVPHVMRGGSNALDLSEYFRESAHPIIGGFGHTRLFHHEEWVNWPVFFAVEENGRDSKVIHLSEPMVFEETLKSHVQTNIVFPVTFGVQNERAHLTVGLMDRSTRIIFFPIKELIQEIKESMSKNAGDGVTNIHEKVEKMIKDITSSLPTDN